ncbi:unnamed protein product [Rotaria socialis]|nr:unnamed protein product [Rotaria socialis]
MINTNIIITTISLELSQFLSTEYHYGVEIKRFRSFELALHELFHYLNNIFFKLMSKPNVFIQLILPPSICLVTNALFLIDNFNRINNANVFLNEFTRAELYHESINFDIACKEALHALNIQSGQYGTLSNFSIGSDRTITNREVRQLRQQWRNYEIDQMPLGRHIKPDGINRTNHAIKQMMMNLVKAVLRYNPNINLYIKQQFINDIPIPFNNNVINENQNVAMDFEVPVDEMFPVAEILNNLVINPVQQNFPPVNAPQNFVPINFNQHNLPDNNVQMNDGELYVEPLNNQNVDQNVNNFNNNNNNIPNPPINIPNFERRTNNRSHSPRSYRRPYNDHKFRPPTPFFKPSYKSHYKPQHIDILHYLSSSNEQRRANSSSQTRSSSPSNKCSHSYHKDLDIKLPSPIQNVDNNINNNYKTIINKPNLKRNNSVTDANSSCSSLEKSLNKNESFIRESSPLSKKTKFSDSSSKNMPSKIGNIKYNKCIQDALKTIDKYRKEQTSKMDECKKTTSELRKYRIPKKYATVCIPKIPNFIIKFIGDSTAKHVYEQIVDAPHNFNISLLTFPEKDLKSITDFLMADATANINLIADNEKVVYLVFAGQHDMTRATGKMGCELNPMFIYKDFVDNYYLTELFVKSPKFSKIKIIWIVPLIVDFKRYCNTGRYKLNHYDLTDPIDRHNFEKSMVLRSHNIQINEFLTKGECSFINLQCLNSDLANFSNIMPSYLSIRKKDFSFPSFNITADGLHLNQLGSTILWHKIENLINNQFSE